MSNFIFTSLLFLFSCSLTTVTVPDFNVSMRSVSEIPLPQGFERMPVQPNSFAAYLRNLPLRKDKTVYLFNGQAKSNQTLHYAVIDVSTGDKDLQQCADAVMRLRAEYFFNKKMYDSIRFPKGDHGVYQFSTYLKNSTTDVRQSFLKFMETVFIYCGTYTLEQSLKPVIYFADMQPGDVLVKGGAPGHAVIVADMAVDKRSGKKIFLLAEGFMPAQDMHIVLNPLNTAMGPWYEITDSKRVVSPGWTFETKQLRRW
jgi:hypothetical protein